jgi:hypothetical protein
MEKGSVIDIHNGGFFIGKAFFEMGFNGANINLKR